MSTLTTRVGALETDVAEIKDSLRLLLAKLDTAEPAKAPARKAAVTQPKAGGKVYRSAKGKEQAKKAVEQVWIDAKAKARVKRVRDLTPAQRKAADAKVKAIWAAVPKTRTTKA